MMCYCAGIDLGTTNTVLSVWTEGDPGPNIVPIRQPVKDITPDGMRSLPLLDSVVTLVDGKVYVGAFARGLALINPSFSSIKRFMGRHWFRTHGGVGWTPERVSACILKVVYNQLIAQFGILPERLIVTIPASFGSEARRATFSAACIAGFDPATISLFDEPTAALLAQLHDKSALQTTSESSDLHAVVDIGGGTMDVSLVRIHADRGHTIFDVIGQSRYNELAGDDFDLNIAGLLLHRFETEVGPIHSRFGSDTQRTLLFWLLLQKARDVKHRLSAVLADQPPGRWSSIRESVVFTEFPDIAPWRTELSGRDLVNALYEYFPALDNPNALRSEFGFFRPIQECLDTASLHEGSQLGPFDVASVWMAGGSASLPPVRLALRHIFGSRPTMIRDPMFAVARGAAWKAGLDAGFSDGRFSVRERVFDGVFLKTTQGDYRPLVRVRQEVPMPRTEFPGMVEMPLPDNRLLLELYAGTQPDPGGTDPTLEPLARRVVTFPEILPSGTSISLAAKMTADRQLHLELNADIGREVQGLVSVGTAPGWNDSGTVPGLPPINEVGGST